MIHFPRAPTEPLFYFTSQSIACERYYETPHYVYFSTFPSIFSSLIQLPPKDFLFQIPLLYINPLARKWVFKLTNNTKITTFHEI